MASSAKAFGVVFLPRTGTAPARRWVGEGPVYMKIGGRVVYRLDDILAYEQAQLRQNTPSVVGAGAAG